MFISSPEVRKIPPRMSNSNINTPTFRGKNREDIDSDRIAISPDGRDPWPISGALRPSFWMVIIKVAIPSRGKWMRPIELLTKMGRRWGDININSPNSHRGDNPPEAAQSRRYLYRSVLISSGSARLSGDVYSELQKSGLSENCSGNVEFILDMMWSENMDLKKNCDRPCQRGTNPLLCSTRGFHRDGW